MNINSVYFHHQRILLPHDMISNLRNCSSWKALYSFILYLLYYYSYEKYRDEVEAKELTLHQLSTKVGRLEEENSQLFEGKLHEREVELKEQARQAQNDSELKIFKLNQEERKLKNEVSKLQEQLRGIHYTLVY